jgi:hypothetical protein
LQGVTQPCSWRGGNWPIIDRGPVSGFAESSPLFAGFLAVFRGEEKAKSHSLPRPNVDAERRLSACRAELADVAFDPSPSRVPPLDDGNVLVALVDKMPAAEATALVLKACVASDFEMAIVGGKLERKSEW